MRRNVQDIRQNVDDETPLDDRRAPDRGQRIDTAVLAAGPAARRARAPAWPQRSSRRTGRSRQRAASVCRLRSSPRSVLRASSPRTVKPSSNAHAIQLGDAGVEDVAGTRGRARAPHRGKPRVGGAVDGVHVGRQRRTAATGARVAVEAPCTTRPIAGIAVPRPDSALSRNPPGGPSVTIVKTAAGSHPTKHRRLIAIFLFRIGVTTCSDASTVSVIARPRFVPPVTLLIRSRGHMHIIESEKRCQMFGVRGLLPTVNRVRPDTRHRQRAISQLRAGCRADAPDRLSAENAGAHRRAGARACPSGHLRRRRPGRCRVRRHGRRAQELPEASERKMRD